MGATALLVDFGGTLDADGAPWVDRFFRLYQRGNGVLDRNQFRQAFAKSDELLAELPGVSALDYSGTVSAQAELLAQILPDGAAIAEPALRAQFIDEARVVARRNRAVLVGLGARYRLAVVSNYQGNLQPCLDELDLGDLFDVVSDSDIVGSRKPDRRIFDVTLAALECVAQDCWMIGDSPPNDIAAANALGMQTCWMAPLERSSTGIPASARVARFDHVPLVLAA